MSVKINALEENTYELIPVPIDKKIIGGRWIYTIKCYWTYTVKLGQNNLRLDM